jgi:TetR/AcrR family transcriptional repressor of lmrAB and yxaGH operons
VDSYAKEMEDSDFHHGCPVATVALEASSTSPVLRKVCEGIFSEWESLLAARLERDGFEAKEAQRFASVILSALEGAMILCRTRKNTAPLKWVAEHLTALLAAK